MPKACEPQRLRKPPNRVSEALPSLSDRTRTFWVRMEIIESFQSFKNLVDRTFRGRSLGYQDEYEPEVDVAERSNAWRMRRTVPWSEARAHPYRPDARTRYAIARSLPNWCIDVMCPQTAVNPSPRSATGDCEGTCSSSGRKERRHPSWLCTLATVDSPP